MNDKDRDLIVQALHDVGKIGESAFSALVRWQFIEGLTTFLTSCIVVGLSVWALRRLLQWKPNDDFDDGIKHFFKGAGIVVCLGIVAIVTCSGLQAGLRDMLAPDGAAVAWLTAHR